MKRINSEQINTFVHNFLKRRNYYSDNNILQMNRKTNKLKSKSMSLGEVALNGSLANASSDSDVICLSQSNRLDLQEFTELAEKAFKHLLEFVAQFKAKQRVWEQLSQLEFPIFLYIFIELFENGYKIAARRFFRDHKTRFKESSELQIIESMNKSLNTFQIEASLKVYKTMKYSVKISDKCFEQMKKYFKDMNDLIIVQILNNSIDFNLYSTHNQTETEKKFDLMNPFLSKCSQYNELELIPSNLKSLQSTTNDNQILNCIEKVRNSDPCVPSICLYTIKSPNLTSVSVTDDMVSLAMGFENSTICLKSFGQNVVNCESDIEVKRKSCQIELNLIDHDIEDNANQELNNDNKCDTNDKSFVTLRGHSGPVYDLTFVRRTNLLLSCSCDTTVRAWDTTNGNNVFIFDSHMCPVWTIDSSVIGNYFCTGSRDSMSYLWSLERSFPLRQLCGHNLSVNCVKFHPNCNFIATASADKEIKLWDIQTPKAVRTLVGHKAPIYCLSFSSCGHYLASAGEDRKVLVWDLMSGNVLKEFSGHSDVIYSVCFNYNNSILSSGGADQTLKLWNLNNITNSSTKPFISDSDNSQNTSGQLMSYQLDSNVIHSQFMPKNLLLSISTQMPSN